MTNGAEGERWCEKDQRFFNPSEWRLHLSMCNEHPGVWLWSGDWFKVNENEADPQEGWWWVCRKKIGATSVQFGPLKESKADELIAQLTDLEQAAAKVPVLERALRDAKDYAEYALEGFDGHEYNGRGAAAGMDMGCITCCQMDAMQSIIRDVAALSATEPAKGETE